MNQVSILIPHYNDPDGLRLTLRGVAAQTWQGPLEVVVCDDGSRSDVRAQLDAIQDDFGPAMTVLHNERNRGRPHTRNRLLDAATGDYITWCDSGDEIYPSKIAQQIQGLQSAADAGLAGPVWCTCNFDMHWMGRDPKKGKQRIDGDPIANLLQARLRAYLFSVIGTAQSFRDVGYFDEELPRLQDLDFFLRFAIKGGAFIFPPTDDALCIYHKSDAGKDADQITRCFRHIYRKHAAVLMTYPRRFRRARHADVYLQAARYASNNDERLRKALYLGRAALAGPRHFAITMFRNRGRL